MRVIEVFKTKSEEERRKAVTEILIELERQKHNESKSKKPQKAG